MKKKLVVAVIGLTLCVIGGQFEDRWVYFSRNLTKSEHVQEVSEIVKVAKSVGLNGILFACDIERWHIWSAHRKANLEKVKRICEASGVEIVPILWSVGYGGYNPNYAAALPCTNVPFVVKGDVAEFAGGGVPKFANPGFDEMPTKSHCVPKWLWTDKPGEVTFIDPEVKANGTASLRIENYGANAHGQGRACHSLKVNPDGRYRVSCMMKTEGATPTSGVILQVCAKDGAKVVGKRYANLATTQDWTRVACMFNAAGKSDFRVYAGIWGGRKGCLWIDDFKVEDMGCAPPLLREDLSFVVRDMRTGATLRADEDYEVPSQKVWNKKWSSFKAIHRGSLREGAMLQVDYWTAAVVANGQRPCCMSSPALYDYYRISAAAVKEALNPRKWFLSMDEIRAGGTCPRCLARGLDMAHQLGECLVRQRMIIKSVRPDAQIYVWSDMLDPAHNAHDNYYACNGTFSGSWDLIPRDFIISCWHGKKRDISMRFFSERGFRTQAAAYYDADDLDGCREWLKICLRTHGCTGIMYTSWHNKYKLLAPFGKLIRNRR